MGNAAVDVPMTAEQFLAWDGEQPERWEFVGGEVFAMTGATVRHAAVTGNLYMALRQHLRGSPCRTIANEVKLRVQASDAYYYPDVMVTCSAADAQEPLIQREPLLLIEVLSKSTASYDRGAKFAAYRSLPSLREYLLIDPASRRCDLYRLGAEGFWVLRPFEAGQAVALESVAMTLSAQALWDEVPAV